MRILEVKMFDNIEAYTGQVVSRDDASHHAVIEPEMSPEEISDDIIAQAQAEAGAIIAEAEERAEKIASDGLLGQILTIQNDKQIELDKAVDTLTAMVGDVVENIIGREPASHLASDIFKTALKKFSDEDEITVEAASDVFPRLQLLGRIDRSGTQTA